jgi:hypothetical protein
MIFVHGYNNIRELFLKHGDIFSERPNVYATEVIRKKKGMLLLFTLALYSVFKVH